MVKINFTDHAGTTRTVDVDVGATVMEAAIRNGHSRHRGGVRRRLRLRHLPRLCRRGMARQGRRSLAMEEDMLDFGYDVRPNSRLSCQIKVTGTSTAMSVSSPSGRHRPSVSNLQQPRLKPRDDVRRQRRRLARRCIDQHRDRLGRAVQTPPANTLARRSRRCGRALSRRCESKLPGQCISARKSMARCTSISSGPWASGRGRRCAAG